MTLRSWMLTPNVVDLCDSCAKVSRIIRLPNDLVALGIGLYLDSERSDVVTMRILKPSNLFYRLDTSHHNSCIGARDG